MKSFLRRGLPCLFFILLGFTGFAQVQTITTIAGNGTEGFSGDGGDPIFAQLYSPHGVAMDSAGNLFIADTYNHAIRKLDTLGVITTVAGDGTPGNGGDGGQATSAQLNFPYGIAVDSTGNLFIADSYNNKIRKVFAASGIITTVAGNGTAGYSGDNGPANSAQLNNPNAVAVDHIGNVFISDSDNHRIRVVVASSGLIITIAGNGTPGYSGDDGLATLARLNYPGGVVLDSEGNIFIADTYNNRVRRVTITGGAITTVAGNGIPGYTGDGVPAPMAQLAYPRGLAFDAENNLYIADEFNSRIRRVSISGIISTVAGNGNPGYGGDGGIATAALLNLAADMAVGSDGSIFIADTGNNRIRKVSPAGSGDIYAYFPQVAVGDGWSTSFALTNTTATYVTGDLTITDNQGNPLIVSTPTLGMGSSFPIALPPGGSMFLTANQVSPTDPRKVGWAKATTTNGSINGVATYQSVSQGIVLTATGVLSSQPTQFATIPVDEKSSENRAVAYAIANQTDQVQVIKVALVDLNGFVVDDTKTITLDPGEQTARYFNQDFLNRPTFQGSLVLRSQGGSFIAVSLIQNEQFFTAIPVIPNKAPNIPN